MPRGHVPDKIFKRIQDMYEVFSHDYPKHGDKRNACVNYLITDMKYRIDDCIGTYEIETVIEDFSRKHSLGEVGHILGAKEKISAKYKKIPNIRVDTNYANMKEEATINEHRVELGKMPIFNPKRWKYPIKDDWNNGFIFCKRPPEERGGQKSLFG